MGYPFLDERGRFGQGRKDADLHLSSSTRDVASGKRGKKKNERKEKEQRFASTATAEEKSTTAGRRKATS